MQNDVVKRLMWMGFVAGRRGARQHRRDPSLRDRLAAHVRRGASGARRMSSAAPADRRPAEPFLPPVGAAAAAKPMTETRPEILVGAAFAGGLVLAKLLGRIRGR